MTCDQQTCIEKLVGIKGTCIENVDCPKFFIDDLEGVDMLKLSQYASSLNVSGERYARELINTAARMMLADVQSLITSGYSLIDAFGETCSTCNFLTSYQVGGGVKVSNIVGSKFSIINISRVEILCNAVGNQVLVLDDGKTKEKFDFVAGGVGVVVPCRVQYSTSEKWVKVYIEDTSVGTAQIVCEKTSGCGCSGGVAPTNTPVSYSGIVLGMDSAIQYGFKVCASVSCSTDVLVCSMVDQIPNMFGLTLLYRVGLQYFGNAPFATRNNRVAMKEQELPTMQDYYEKLYRERMKGTPSVKGMKELMNAYLTRNKDRCVQCENIISISYNGG